MEDLFPQSGIGLSRETPTDCFPFAVLPRQVMPVAPLHKTRNWQTEGCSSRCVTGPPYRERWPQFCATARHSVYKVSSPLIVKTITVNQN